MGQTCWDRPECRRLLALRAAQGRHGHLGIPEDGAPLVLPINYVVQGPDVLVRVGEGLFEKMERARLVAFEVDGIDTERPWSVLVRGLVIEEDRSILSAHIPFPQVADPGHRIVRIRADAISGRRLGSIPERAAAKSITPTR